MKQIAVGTGGEGGAGTEAGGGDGTDGAKVDTQEVKHLFFAPRPSSFMIDDEGDGEEEIDLLGGPIEPVIRRHPKGAAEYGGGDPDGNQTKKPKPAPSTGPTTGASSPPKRPPNLSSGSSATSLNVLRRCPSPTA